MLNAGNYGVPQSRKRTFIWAAAPGEQLPSWPQQQFVFRSPQLAINLPGGVAYTAVPQREVRRLPARGPLGHSHVLRRPHPRRARQSTGAASTIRRHAAPVPSPQGAPLRTVTVRDAIGDLPNIKNGHDL